MSTTTTTTATTTTSTSTSTASCVSAVPDHNGYVPPGSCKSFYDYYPSFALAAIFCAIFFLVTVAHVFQAFYHRKGFCWVICMGSAWEFGSFAFRALSTKHQQNQSYATNSNLLFALAPLWINAFVYMCAGRTMFCFLPEKRVFKIKATSIGKYFVWFDILAFIVQAVGAVMTGPGAPGGNVSIGLHIYQAGIGVQQSFILFFFAMIIGFHKKMLDHEKAGYRDPHNRKWRWLTFTMYFVLTLITLRLAYRLAEMLMGLGKSNPLPNHEIYMYVLDAVPMLIALLSINAIHPGRILVGPGSNYSEGKKEFKAQERLRKQGKSVGDSDEEEGMMLNGSQELGHLPPRTAYGGPGQTQYSPLIHNERFERGQPPLYQHDPEYV